MPRNVDPGLRGSRAGLNHVTLHIPKAEVPRSCRHSSSQSLIRVIWKPTSRWRMAELSCLRLFFFSIFWLAKKGLRENLGHVRFHIVAWDGQPANSPRLSAPLALVRTSTLRCLQTMETSRCVCSFIVFSSLAIHRCRICLVLINNAESSLAVCS